MQYTLIVQSPPSQSPGTPILFAKALLNKGHQIRLVFFQHEGVYWGINKLKPPTDELNYQSEWIELQQAHPFTLGLCSGAAARRGIDTHQLIEPFTLVGYGAMCESVEQSDKVVPFK